jgi:hypothetical protein
LLACELARELQRAGGRRQGDRSAAEKRLQRHSLWQPKRPSQPQHLDHSHLYTTLLKVACRNGDGGELGRAHGSVVIGVREEDSPRVLDVFVELDGTLGGLSLRCEPVRNGWLVDGRKVEVCMHDAALSWGWVWRILTSKSGAMSPRRRAIVDDDDGWRG